MRTLVLTNLLALLAAAGAAALAHSLAAGAVFLAGSVSHWLLDAVVHLGDLPVLGFARERDRRVGLGLWRRPAVAFVLEFLVYAVPTALVFPWRRAFPLLIVGAAFHLLNANAFFGLTRRNPTGTPRRFAGLVLFGFFALGWVLQGAVR